MGAFDFRNPLFPILGFLTPVVGGRIRIRYHLNVGGVDSSRNFRCRVSETHLFSVSFHTHSKQADPPAHQHALGQPQAE